MNATTSMPKPKQPEPLTAHKRFDTFIGAKHTESASYGEQQDAAYPSAAGVPWINDESFAWLPGVVQRKPGALRNGASFGDLPPTATAQAGPDARCRRRHGDGTRAM